MRITNQNQTQVPTNDASTSADPATTSRTDAAGPASSLPSLTSQTFPVNLVPSFELLSLQATLQHIPPVRADVIAETVRRLASTQLQTPGAVEETARAMLGQ
jgi:hypothetical protein